VLSDHAVPFLSHQSCTVTVLIQGIVPLLRSLEQHRLVQLPMQVRPQEEVVLVLDVFVPDTQRTVPDSTIPRETCAHRW
jgi:hypothetical protein